MIVSEISANSYKKVYIALLISITLEEAGLWHIINAEGEKIQAVNYGIVTGKYDVNDAILIQNTINSVIRSAIQMEMLLQHKLELVIDAMVELDKAVHNNLLKNN